MKKIFAVSFVILLLGACAQQSMQTVSSNEITPVEVQQHIRYLASDELGGRKAGEPGNRIAAEYIAKEFHRYGLQPAGDKGGYLQQFDFVSNVKEGTNNSLSINGCGKSLDLVPGSDFRPLSFSADTSVTAPLAFAGYGIAADSLHYNDYGDIDVSHKIIIVLRYSPKGKGPDSVFNKYTSFAAKTYTARDKGASGIIFVSGPLDDPEPTLIPFKSQMQSSSGIAVATMKWTLLDSVLHCVGRDLRSLQQEINSSQRANSFELNGISVSLKTEVVKVYASTANILGYLEGSDSLLKNQLLVIGAHMDHLGMGGEGSGSLQPDTVAVHHGADDNASGTAGLLELAQYFSARRAMIKRSILFTAFTGEELGLLGSAHYVNHPFVPLTRTVTMLNMDMIGRMKDSVLQIGGIGTSPQWEKLVRKENPDSSLHLKLMADGFGPSDHASFYTKDIPVLFFFTALHQDYHRPSDTWDKINYADEQRVIDYVSRIAYDVLNDPLPPTFTKVAAPPTQAGGDRSGLQVSLGVMPDFEEGTVGLKITGARAGSPADKAGLKAGDIIIKLGGKDVKNIYDYMYLLGMHRPGDEVIVVVKRGTEELSLKAVLEAKKQ